MSGIQDYLTPHHRHCDELLIAVENHVDEEDFTQAGEQWQQFQRELERHLAMEEEILFPRFEQATGIIDGPTEVMRSEHQQMRATLMELDESLSQGDGDRTLGLIDGLMVLIQQHNMKEEQMLYPMADNALPDAADTVDAMAKL